MKILVRYQFMFFDRQMVGMVCFMPAGLYLSLLLIKYEIMAELIDQRYLVSLTAIHRLKYNS